MANDEHIALLKQGVAAWNAWRQENPDVRPDLNDAELRDADLSKANFRQVTKLTEATLDDMIDYGMKLGANLSDAHLFNANLSRANLSGADLSRAHLHGANLRLANFSRARLWDAILSGDANLSGANLSRADLSRAGLPHANLSGANLSLADLSSAGLISANLSRANLNPATLRGTHLVMANLSEANLSRAILAEANLSDANLSGANLCEASLYEANLSRANLSGAKLIGVNLSAAQMVGTDLTGADLTGSRIYGVSAWNLKLERTKQQNLVITDREEPEITVDNIEVAQFVYLLLHNEKIRDVIDPIGRKAVLILGRFTADRKAVLDALREELRKRDYLPILFDFDVPATRDITETVSLLARMARFIIADLTDPTASPRSWKLSFPVLQSPFNRSSKVRLGPTRCSETTGSTNGCFRSTDTWDLSRCSQRSRRRLSPLRKAR
jgi:uncharacterized protein YjbI with pentapeptide repeats